MSHEELFRHLEIRRVPKPWGYELIFAKTERYVGKILHINQGESLSLQYHEVKEETLYVVAGELKLTIGQGFDMGRPSILDAMAEKKAGRVTMPGLGIEGESGRVRSI